MPPLPGLKQEIHPHPSLFLSKGGEGFPYLARVF